MDKETRKFFSLYRNIDIDFLVKDLLCENRFCEERAKDVYIYLKGQGNSICMASCKDCNNLINEVILNGDYNSYIRSLSTHIRNTHGLRNATEAVVDSDRCSDGVERIDQIGVFADHIRPSQEDGMRGQEMTEPITSATLNDSLAQARASRVSNVRNGDDREHGYRTVTIDSCATEAPGDFEYGINRIVESLSGTAVLDESFADITQRSGVNSY